MLRTCRNHLLVDLYLIAVEGCRAAMRQVAGSRACYSLAAKAVDWQTTLDVRDAKIPVRPAC